MDSKAWDQRYAEGARNGTIWGLEPNRWVVAETTGLPAGRALDLAAGEGRNALWLAQQGWQVLAVDFSAVALETGQRLAGEVGPAVADRITWVFADLLQYVPQPGAADLVLVCYLHLPAPARRTMLRRAAEAVAPGGTLLVIGHDLANLTEGTGGPQDPSILLTAADVLADLDGLPGLTVVRAEPVRRPVSTDDGEQDAVDTLVRVQRTG